jgi:tetratricopeptide (TPR) repeat protein
MLIGRSTLSSSLQVLQKQGLIQQLRVLPEHVYRFKNVLTQEVAYDSLLVHQRRALHQAAGEAIETLYKDRIEEQVELLVHHYSLAENWERAIHFGIQSADKAVGLSRFGEALAMLEQAQEWIAKLPAGEESEGPLASVLLKQERLCETLRLRERQQELIDRLLDMLVPAGDRGLLAEVLVRQGELFTLLGRFEDAERALTEALGIHRELDNPTGECVALRTIGFLRWQQGRYDDSLESNKKALAIDLAQNDRAAYAQDLTNIASVLRNQGHAREALRYLEEALQIHEEMRRPHLQAYNLHVMGNTYRDLGDAEKAFECYQRANQTGIEHKLPLNRVIVVTSLASLAWENGWVDESLRFNSDLIGITRGLGLKHELALALATRSQRLLDLERSEEAIPLLREATETFAELGEKQEEARTLSSLAYVQERYSDDPVDSLAIWEKVRSLRREQDDPIGQLEALEGMSRVARSQLKKPDLAVEYLRQAFQVASTVGDPARQGDLLNTMGILEWGRGNYGTALDHYRKAHSIFLDAGDRVHVGLMLNSIGVTLAKMGRKGEAASRLHEALQTHRETGQRLLEGHALAALGDLFAEPGSYDQALDHYSGSLDIRREIGDRKGEGWMLYQMARVNQLAGHATESVNLATSAAQIAAEIGDRQLESTCVRLQSKPS